MKLVKGDVRPRCKAAEISLCSACICCCKLYSVIICALLLFSRSVVSNYLWAHGLQCTRLPWPSLYPGVHSNPVHWVDDAIQPSHPLLPPSPPVLNLSGLFQGVISSHQVAKVLELQLQHQSWMNSSVLNEYSGLISFRLISLLSRGLS